MHGPSVCCMAAFFSQTGNMYSGRLGIWKRHNNYYDTIDWHGMWQMIRLYGVGGKLLKAVQSFL